MTGERHRLDAQAVSRMLKEIDQANNRLRVECVVRRPYVM